MENAELYGFGQLIGQGVTSPIVNVIVGLARQLWFASTCPYYNKGLDQIATLFDKFCKPKLSKAIRGRTIKAGQSNGVFLWLLLN
jgi:hypothetical protein